MKALPDAETIRGLLNYDTDTGVFTWRKSRPHCRVGDVAGSTDKDGYILIGINGTQHRAHLLAWVYVHGVPPEKEIDHRNLVRSYNPISNLREGTRRENIANAERRSTNTSGQKGVYWCKQNNKWKVRIRGEDGKHRYLGLFTDVVEAGAAYKAAAQAMYGEFARGA